MICTITSACALLLWLLIEAATMMQHEDELKRVLRRVRPNWKHPVDKIASK